MPDPASHTTTATPGAAPPTVLVVDDDPALRFALQEGLAAYGFEVHAAADEATASQMAIELRPDLVLLDWRIPGGDGGDVACRRLRAVLPDTPVVMLTGLADGRDERAARAAGASAFLVKGIALDALVDQLRRLLP
jgi:two-component system response regulator MprA